MQTNISHTLDQPILQGTYHANMDDAAFFHFCKKNDPLRIERTPDLLMVQSPTGSYTGYRNSELNRLLGNWNAEAGTGYVFDSSTGYQLAPKTVLSPDASWIAAARWSALTTDQREGFAPLCPDFVVELRSRNDALPFLRAKMELWLEHHCRLAWLLDPYDQKAYVYRPEQEVEIVTDFRNSLLSGEDVLPGFELALDFLTEE